MPWPGWCRPARTRCSPRSPTSSRRRGWASCSRSRPELREVIEEVRPSWADADVSALPEPRARAAAAYRAWIERSGSQEAAFTGEATWSPERRFGRVFERLSLPGFNRAARFDLLTSLGAAGRYPLEADGVHFVEDDATVLAAKRLLVSGDRMLLERRARDLADACGVPISALDRGLATWGTHGEHVDLTAEPDPGRRRGPRPALASCGLHDPRTQRLADARAARPAACHRRRRDAGAGAPVAAAGARVLRARGALAHCSRRSRPTTRGPGSSGAARSRTSTS